MKRRFAAILLLALGLALICAMAQADDVRTSGDFQYTLKRDGSAELVAYTGDADNVIIPNGLDGHAITSVQGNPFYYYNSYSDYGVKACTVSVATDHPYLATIQGVLFGKSDARLIYYSPLLTASSYEIPLGIRVIGSRAFYGCGSLTEVNIPESVNEIGQAAFRACSGLKRVELPKGLTSIENETFHSCGSLAEISIPDHVIRIGSNAFWECASLTSVTIPDSVSEIGYAAFGKTGLINVVIPQTVRTIGDNAFGINPSLMSITFPEGMEVIPSGIVFRCTALTEITIPASVRSIGGSAFEACTGLTSVIIPEGVASIGDFAFDRCENLVSVVIPDSVTEIGEHAFDLGTFGSWYVNPNLLITVSRGSVGESYCIANGIRYTSPDVTYGDDDSWLVWPVWESESVAGEDGWWDEVTEAGEDGWWD